MILKFNEYINEGLWSKGIERSKSNDMRLERSNINSIKFIDLGLDFLIADKDLIIDDKDLVNYEEMKSYCNFIENKGYRIPLVDDLKNSLDKSFLKYSFKDKIVIITSSKTNEQIEFTSKWSNDFSETYWLCDEPEVNDKIQKLFVRQWEVICDSNPKFLKIPRSRYRYGEKQNRCHIRLIKDK